MATIIIIYILGYIASLLIMYNMIPKGDKIDLKDILVALFASTTSWAAVIILFIFKYSDKVIFIKK